MTSTSNGAPTTAIYWRRRLFVVGVLVALALIVVNVVNGGSDPDAGVQATVAGSDQGGTDSPDSPDSPDSTEIPVATPTTGPSASKNPNGKKNGSGKKGDASAPTVIEPPAPVLVDPEGECVDADVRVTPTVKRAVAGRTALIVLELRTLTSPACTWQVTPESLTVRVSVGDDEVWASRECPAVLPVLPVVVRSAVSSTYEFRWNTRRSDEACPALTQYAPPGEYRVTAAAFSGEPEYEIFDLAAPTAPEPEPQPELEPKKSEQKKGKKRNAGA